MIGKYRFTMSSQTVVLAPANDDQRELILQKLWEAPLTPDPMQFKEVAVQNAIPYVLGDKV